MCFSSTPPPPSPLLLRCHYCLGLELKRQNRRRKSPGLKYAIIYGYGDRKNVSFANESMSERCGVMEERGGGGKGRSGRHEMLKAGAG